MRLQDAIDQYVQSRQSLQYAPNTVRASRQALELLITTTGNIQTKNLSTQHGERFVAEMLSRGYKPGTVNLYRGHVSLFCKWAHQRRLLAANSNPLGTTRALTNTAAPRRRVPARDFERLLDAAPHPHHRIIVALGLYLFLRASEISYLDIEHVDLDEGAVKVYQPKTKRWDVMPICEELDTELRRWLTWYAEDQARADRGPLMPHWPLVPARQVTNQFGKYPLEPDWPGQMNPRSRCKHAHVKAQETLRAYGWDVTGDDREGVHTLRRSGARALFDALVDDGRIRDGALRVVQAMLHHRSVSTTEGYLGLEADLEKRDSIIAGKRMFAKPKTDNVVTLVPATMDS